MKEYQIIEYCNPCFPDVPYYKCTINKITRHSNKLNDIIEWRDDRINNAEHYAKLAKIETKAMATYMKDVAIKD